MSGNVFLGQFFSIIRTNKTGNRQIINRNISSPFRNRTLSCRTSESSNKLIIFKGSNSHFTILSSHLAHHVCIFHGRRCIKLQGGSSSIFHICHSKHMRIILYLKRIVCQYFDSINSPGSRIYRYIQSTYSHHIPILIRVNILYRKIFFCFFFHSP